MLQREDVRAVKAPFHLPDEQLEYWAETYLAMPHLRRYGITFDIFLQATPQVREHPTRLVILAVRFRLDEQACSLAQSPSLLPALDALPSAGSRQIEKLRHHRYPRHA